jgi:hypothetical protein
MLLALLAFPFVLKAQIDTTIRIKIDSFFRGGDSVRYTIRGMDDTLQITKLFRSGRISIIDWKTDSSYRYNILGHLESQSYNNEKDSTAYSTQIDYYSNGKIFTKNTHSSNGHTSEYYEVDGQLNRVEKTEHLTNIELSKTMDKTGRILNSIGVYTLGTTIQNTDSSIRYDTLFYANGNIFSIEISNNNSVSYGKKYFKKDGNLLKEEAPESERLIVFKDNLGCYYGLKTAKGDTIVKPTYEKIGKLGETFWAAEYNDKISLFYIDGTPAKLFSSNISIASQFKIKGDFITDDTLTKHIREDLFIDNAEYFSYYENFDMGVFDNQGQVVIKPQHVDLMQLCIGEQYFKFKKNLEKGYQKGYLDRTGKPLFDNKYNNVLSAYCNDFFYINNDADLTYGHTNDEEIGNKYSDGGSISFDDFEGKPNALFGLGKADGTVLLKPKYCAMECLPYSTIFITSSEIKKGTFKEEDIGALGKEGSKWVNHSVYDAHAQRWLFDKKGHLVRERESYLEIKDIARKKYGILDFSGKFILPIEFDSISSCGENSNLNWVIKDGKYQKFQFKNNKIVFSPNKYDFLDAFGYHNDGRSGTNIYYFAAKKDGKWGIIDEEERIIKPFEFDYASVYGGYEGNILLVKKDRAYAYDFESLPNERVSYHHIGKYSTPDELGEYPIADNPNQTIIINNIGKVVIPPQYKVLQKGSYNFILFEDDNKQKKLLNLNTSTIIDFPFDYNLEYFQENKPLIVVRNKTDNTLGLVSKDGKIIAPCHHYGMQVSDDSPVFFAKKEAPFIKQKDEKIEICGDTLSIEDVGWKMYDFQGKLLNKTDFNLSISFYKGVGIGLQNRTFNLYKADGTLLRPFNTEGVPIDSSLVFDNIRITEGSLHYVFYYRQGLNPLMMVTKPNGEIIVNGGRYENISPFYGKYALVQVGSKIGMIDWSGKEIIAPQDLRTYKDHFIDSLQIKDTSRYTKQELEYLKFVSLPFSFEEYNNADKFINPDSLNISVFEKAALWNLLLEQCVSLMDGTEKDISRPKAYKSAEYFNEISCRHAEKKNNSLERIRSTYIGKSMASILFDKSRTFSDNLHEFLNFHYKNGRWENLKLSGLLYLEGEKRQKLNDIVAQKIKNLTDAFIDCSDPSNFLRQVEDKWLVNKEGVSFYFDSRRDYTTRSKIVLLTWEELSPFLKMK